MNFDIFVFACTTNLRFIFSSTLLKRSVYTEIWEYGVLS